jgi:hypothetical protein
MTTEQIFGLLLLLVAYSGISLYVALLEAIRYYRLKKAAEQKPTALLGVVTPPKRKRD